MINYQAPSLGDMSGTSVTDSYHSTGKNSEIQPASWPSGFGSHVPMECPQVQNTTAGAPEGDMEVRVDTEEWEPMACHCHLICHEPTQKIHTHPPHRAKEPRWGTGSVLPGLSSLCSFLSNANIVTALEAWHLQPFLAPCFPEGASPGTDQPCRLM